MAFNSADILRMNFNNFNMDGLLFLKKTMKCSEMLAYITPCHAGESNTATILCASSLPNTRVVGGSKGNRSCLNAMQGSLCTVDKHAHALIYKLGVVAHILKS